MTRRLHLGALLVGVLLGTGEGDARAAILPPVALNEGTTPLAVLVLPATPDPLEQLAARELGDHLQLMTGAELPRAISGHEPAGLLPVHLGAAADPALDALSLAAGNNPSTFTLRVTPERIDLRGLSPEGTLFAAYELLEQLGFRWYMPGELGCVLPTDPVARLTAQTTTQAPSMDLRLLQPWIEAQHGWIARMRLGGQRRATGSHGFPGDPPRGALGGQICVSGGFAPGAIAAVVAAIRAAHEPTTNVFHLGMGPEDGLAYTYCNCAGCLALDQGVHDPFYNAESMTDRYIWFFNRILEELELDYPNLHIAWYVYQRHMMPPKTAPNPRIVPVFAPINIDRMHAMNNPMAPERHTLRWLIREWQQTHPNEMYYRGYYNNLACPQFPKTQLDQVRHEIPELHARGVRVMRVEVIRHAWAADPLTLYVAARMMWNVHTDVDALLTEFYEKFYGPAAEPMRAYHEQLEAAFRDTPFFAGGSFLYFPLFLEHPRRDELRARLAAAAALIPDPDSLYAQRLWALQQGYRRMDLFLDMIQARNRFDFASAHELMRAYDELTEALVDYNLEPDIGRGPHAGLRLVALSESQDRGQRSYFNRFWRDPVVSGFARTVAQGQLVAGLPDEWEFLLDPTDAGEIFGYQRPGPLGGNWQPLKTSSRSWSDQGLHHYKGVAWYRAAVTIPAEFKDRPLYLWFGGVDEIAHVWLNGQFLGTSQEPEEGLPGAPGSFRPVDFPATAAALPGAENWVVVKVENRRLDELGTGGLTAPVMFWAPNDPAWKP